MENKFAGLMVIESTQNSNNEENLKSISNSFIKAFVNTKKLLTTDETKANIIKRQSLSIGFAIASGKNRAKEAIKLALLPLLKDKQKLEHAKTVSLLITSEIYTVTLDEIGEINDYIQKKLGYNADIVLSIDEDENLGESIAVNLFLSDKIEEK